MSESPRIWSVTSLENSQREYFCEEILEIYADVLQDEKAFHIQALQEQVNANYTRGCIFSECWRFWGYHVQNIKVREAHFASLAVLFGFHAYQCSEVLSIWIACDRDPVSPMAQSHLSRNASCPAMPQTPYPQMNVLFVSMHATLPPMSQPRETPAHMS